MLKKLMAIIELWIGLGFVISLLNLLPVLNIVGNVLGGLIGFFEKMPYYRFFVIVLGSILFFDGLFEILRR